MDLKHLTHSIFQRHFRTLQMASFRRYGEGPPSLLPEKQLV
jgi:hypothetical protein